MIFTDAAKVSATRKTEEGYVIADAFAVRTGIQLYSGKEVDPENQLGLRDRAVVRVYRSEKEVRDANSLRSFSHAPITIGHPDEAVTSQNWKDLAVGEVSTEATWEDNKIRLPLILKDQRAVGVLDRGTRELSAGYRCQLVVSDGVTPEGETYDAEQTNIRVNHLAIVPRGRAGAECRIADGFADHWGAAPLDSKETPMSTKPVVLGDSRTIVNIPVEDAPKVEAYIAQLQSDHAKAMADAKAKHDKAMGEKDAELITAQDAAKELQAKVMTDAQVDARAQERQQLFDAALKLAPGLPETVRTMSDADVRRQVLIKRFGDAKRVEGKTDDWVQGVFDSLALNLPRSADPLIAARALSLGDGNTRVEDAGDAGFSSFCDSLTDAWKRPAANAKEI